MTAPQQDILGRCAFFAPRPLYISNANQKATVTKLRAQKLVRVDDDGTTYAVTLTDEGRTLAKAPKAEVRS